MKLLIVTQALDSNHAILGFFCRWILEFAKHTEHIHVIALQVGEHNLPENVTVHSLGKESGTNIFQKIFRFFSLITSLKNEYDSVFVHMNPEYIVLAGWWWRMQGKKIALWYTHKSVDLKLRIAIFFADVVFSASEASFRLKTNKLHVMGHGIDTDFFKPDPRIKRGNQFLSVGRLDKTKRHDLAIQVAHDAGVPLRIAGDGSERTNLEAFAKQQNADVVFLGPLTQTRLRGEYQQAARLIHCSETGSLDKVVLEALACDLPIDTTDPALKFLEEKTSEYIKECHSLQKLIPQILKQYEKD